MRAPHSRHVAISAVALLSSALSLSCGEQVTVDVYGSCVSDIPVCREYRPRPGAGFDEPAVSRACTSDGVSTWRHLAGCSRETTGSSPPIAGCRFTDGTTVWLVGYHRDPDPLFPQRSDTVTLMTVRSECDRRGGEYFSAPLPAP